ncbi:MAG: hypothetical protein IPG45_17145 [Deltaproteobacteria bacterium]|nr:hypothetical protein [Deltaproteobacteria bacterium]
MADEEGGARGYRVVSGEATPPDEHTARVRAAQAQAERDKAPPTQLKVHDPAGEQPPPAEARSSTEMAESSRRARRRERDRRAERRAIQLVIAVFVGLGGAGLLAVNYLVEDDQGPPTEGPRGPAVPPPPKTVPGKRSTFAEGADIPAIGSMNSEGLTIAAEGLPEVLADVEDGSLANLAGLQTCRYAYGVWEFSPNKRFRFLTTCEALVGQVLVGAYEIQGTVVRMSPLSSVEGTLTSEFQVEKPSTIKTIVQTRSGRTLQVNQRVTTMRSGLDGEAFRATYFPKNTIQIPGQRGGDAPPPPSPGGLKDLLEGGGE